MLAYKLIISNSIQPTPKLIFVNTPHNPTGKIFSKEELQNIANIVLKYPNCFVLEDSVYEHLVYGNYEPF